MAKTRHQDGWVEPVGKREKRWRGHYYVRDSEDRRHHKVVDLGKRSEVKKWQAEQALRQHIAEQTSSPVQAEDRTLEWYWRVHYLPSRTWDESTRSSVVSVVTRHVLPVIGSTLLNSCERTCMQILLNEVAEKYSRSIVQKVRVQLTAILEEAYQAKLIDRNPGRGLKMPVTRKPCSRFLTLEEIQAFVTQLDGRNHLICRLAILCGLRPAELFALRWRDYYGDRLRIDEALGFRLRRVKGTKTQASDSWVYLPQSLRDELAVWQESALGLPDAFIFPSRTGGAIDPHSYERDVIVPAATRAGIMVKPAKDREKGSPRRNKATAVNFQAFRRTCATWFQRHGGPKDAQAHMRHADATTTLRYYQQAIPESVRVAVEALDKALSTAPNIPTQQMN